MHTQGLLLFCWSNGVPRQLPSNDDDDDDDIDSNDDDDDDIDNDDSDDTWTQWS